jgi:hypothetical protein
MTRSPAPHVSDIDLERQRDRYISRSLAYLIFLNGAGALILMAGLAFIPQLTTADLGQLTWAMIVFGAGATAGLLSALLAYLNRMFTVEAPHRSNLRSLLRFFAILVAVTGGVAFLIGLNMVGNAAPTHSSTHPKSKRENGAPASATKSAERLTQRIAKQSPKAALVPTQAGIERPAIETSELNDVGGQPLFVFTAPRHLALRRAMLPERRTSD